MPNDSTHAWPHLDREQLEWHSQYAELSHGDRRVSGSQYWAAIPPFIKERTPLIGARVASLARAAEADLIRFDASLMGELDGYAPLLLRSESAASSQIENLTASARSILTAELGPISARNATEIIGNTRAMEVALDVADELTPSSVLQLHKVLMAGTQHTPGEWRSESVWIGSSARSPIGAVYVAPQFSRVPPLMNDLMDFVRRRDLPVLTQVAVAHAQFETIHPFSDGNGRTGRALVQSMLRAKDITRTVTVPVSAGLLTDVTAYHAALTSYREGDIEPIVEQFALASVDAIANARVLLGDLTALGEQWAELAKPRTGSQLERVIAFALRRPVFTATVLAEHLGVAAPNAYPHVRRLIELGIVQKKNEHKIGQVFRADGVLRALDRFAARAGRRSDR